MADQPLYLKAQKCFKSIFGETKDEFIFEIS